MFLVKNAGVGGLRRTPNGVPILPRLQRRAKGVMRGRFLEEGDQLACRKYLG